MVSEAYYLISKYKVDLTYVDAAGVPFIRSLKLQIGEKAEYHEELQRAKKEGIKPSDVMNIIPVNFGTDNRELLAHAKQLVEAKRVCIHPDFKGLLDQMRAAQAIDGRLDKSLYTMDLMDAFMLAVRFYSFQSP
jgi:hypothetical protein